MQYYCRFVLHIIEYYYKNWGRVFQCNYHILLLNLRACKFTKHNCNFQLSGMESRFRSNINQLHTFDHNINCYLYSHNLVLQDKFHLLLFRISYSSSNMYLCWNSYKMHRLHTIDQPNWAKYKFQKFKSFLLSNKLLEFMLHIMHQWYNIRTYHIHLILMFSKPR